MAQQATPGTLSQIAITVLKAYWGFLNNFTGTQTGAIRVTIKTVITLFLLCLPAAHLNGEPQPVASTAPSPTAVPATTPTSPVYQQGLDQAMEAATLTQTAKTPGELLQVVQHWENAIGRLKLVPAEDANYKVAQQKVGEYQKNLAYAQQRADAASTPSSDTLVAAPTPTVLGISRNAIQSVFEKSEIGYVFSSSPLANGQERVMGRSPNGLAHIELIGSSGNLSQISMMVGMPADNKPAIAVNVVHILGLCKLAIPEWDGASDWISDGITRIANGAEEVSTVQGGKQVKLTYTQSVGLFFISIKPAQ